MKNFTCQCGQLLFFENTRCLSCERALGYHPQRQELLPLDNDSGLLVDGQFLPLCRNGVDYDVCNWLVLENGAEYCMSCTLNDTIPSLVTATRRGWWKSLEHAKRRLIYSLVQLGLGPAQTSSVKPVAFQFIEDQRTNPYVSEEYVSTGYHDGLITINISEADDVSREITRLNQGEPYRTLLGHFRHESGHHYFDALVLGAGRQQGFRELFGDESADYSAAIESYYNNKLGLQQDNNFISLYAQSHPLEDWAECWAHYLHMYDTVDTALAFELNMQAVRLSDFDELTAAWHQLSMALNGLNRSMGLVDAYPFVVTSEVLRKLRFVHESIYPS